ncbi:unnamed protein product [Closterium sp. NIES-53]
MLTTLGIKTGGIVNEERSPRSKCHLMDWSHYYVLLSAILWLLVLAVLLPPLITRSYDAGAESISAPGLAAAWGANGRLRGGWGAHFPLQLRKSLFVAYTANATGANAASSFNAPASFDATGATGAAVSGTTATRVASGDFDGSVAQLRRRRGVCWTSSGGTTVVSALRKGRALIFKPASVRLKYRKLLNFFRFSADEDAIVDWPRTGGMRTGQRNGPLHIDVEDTDLGMDCDLVHLTQCSHTAAASPHRLPCLSSPYALLDSPLALNALRRRFIPFPLGSGDPRLRLRHVYARAALLLPRVRARPCALGAGAEGGQGELVEA